MSGETGVVYTCLVLALTLGWTIRTALAECDTVLGFEDGNITDGQLSASSTYSTTYTAQQARLNVGNGWISYSSNTDREYLQVDLFTQHDVTRYSIQGSGIGWYTRSFQLFYSLDYLTWEQYVSSDGTDTLEGNTDYKSVKTFDLNPPLRARYLVFKPTSVLGRPSLRLELYGCELDQPVPIRHTTVSEDIQDAQEWIPSLSPYVVNSMINIRPSGSVKIQPGVKVVFNSTEAGLLVLGHLETKGLSGLPVEFSRSFPVASHPGQWKGLEVVEQGNLTLEHCIISAAEAGIKGPLSSITVRSCHIHHNLLGVDLPMGDTDSDRIQFLNVLISDNTAQAIRGRAWEEGSNFITVKDSELTRNLNHNVLLERQSTITATNTVFSNSRYGIYESYYGIDITLKNCTFKDNQDSGVRLLNIRSLTKFNVHVSNCSFKNNYYYGFYVQVTRNAPEGSKLLISGSNFTDSNNNGIYVSLKYINKEIPFIITNNTFGAPPRKGYPLVYINVYSSSVDTSFMIKHNTFFVRESLEVVAGDLVNCEINNNSFIQISDEKGVKITGQQKVHIVHNTFVNCSSTYVIATTSPNTNITENIFLNPEASYDLLIEAPFTEYHNLSAKNNFWGSSDKYYVRDRVCDFFCDVNMLMAEVDPFYTTDAMTELSSDLDSDLFYKFGGAVGGRLTQSVIIEPDQLLSVNHSIFIPEGFQLTIQKNVTLLFKYKQGIHARGVLEVEGVEGGRAVMTNDRTDNIKWGGVVINSTESSMKHVLVTNAEKGVQIQTNIIGSVLMNNCEITKCSTAIYGLFWKDLSVMLHRVHITQCTKGLSLKKMNTNTVSLELHACSIDTSNGNEISRNNNLGGFNGGFNVTVKDSNFAGGYVFRIDACHNNVLLIVSNSTFTSTSSYAIDIDAGIPDIQMSNITASGRYSHVTNIHVCARSGQGSGTINIQDSYITNTGYHDTLLIGTNGLGYASHDVVLLNNRIESAYGYKAININIRQYSPPWTIVVQGNTIHDGSLYLYGSSTYGRIQNNTISVSGTQDSLRCDLRQSENCSLFLLENTINQGIVSLATAQANDMIEVTGNVFNGSKVILTSPTTVVLRNTFLNGSDYDLVFSGESHTGREVNCSYNYWGTTDSKDIERRIYDSSYDQKLPTINFVPYYAYPNLTDPQIPVESFLSSDGTIGGSVGGDVTLTLSGSPYTVTANILVDKLETLTIEAGVTLLFPKGIGMTVEGALKVQGNNSHPVAARSLVLGEKWSGIKLRGHVYRSSPAPDDIRLVGGKDEREGRLEVKINGTWGTVCDDSFDQNDANVACRMLGYDPAAKNNKYDRAHFGEGTGPIQLDDLGCTGQENTLFQCRSSKSNCGHSEDAGIRCVGDLLLTPDEIRNEVELSYLSLNDTEQGLGINGNVTLAQGIVSNHSRNHGITIHTGHQALSSLNMENIVTSHNLRSGISFVSDVDRNNLLGSIHLNVTNCKITSNRQNGIHSSYYVFVLIQNCHFSNNKLRAIYLETISSFDVDNSSFSENERGVFGISSYSNSAGSFKLSIRNSKIEDHDMRYYKSGRTWYFHNSLFEIYNRYTIPGSLSFLHNVFSSNIGNIFNFNTYQSNTLYTMNILNNTFKDNNASISTINPSHSQPIQFDFSNNELINNTVPNDNEPLINMKYYINANGSIVNISGNLFVNNTASQAVRLSDIRKLEPNTSITDNVFKKNNCSEIIKTSVFDFVLKENIFDNPDSRCELEAPNFERLYHIDARLNYWGQMGIKNVHSRICGFDSDMGRSFVNYLPYYVSSSLAELSSERHSDFWIDNLLGGVVESYTRLDKSMSPYHIKRSIYIRNEGILEIDDGVLMRMSPATGIYVDGLLLARGISEKIIFTNSTVDSWFGVVLPFKTAKVSKTVRLVNGSTPNEGRVELFVNGSWSTLCNMDQLDATLLCQALGYGPEEIKLKKSAAFGPGSGPIIRDLGCSDEMTSLSQCKPTTFNNRHCNHNNDRGLSCKHFVSLTGDHEFSYLEGVSLLNSKHGLNMQTNTVRLSQCHINNTELTGLILDVNGIDLDLNGTVVEHGGSDGVQLKNGKDVSIRNGTVQHNEGKGLTLSKALFRTLIEKMKFVNNSGQGLMVESQYRNYRKELFIRNNEFVNHTKDYSLQLNVYFETQDVNVYVDSNRFVNNSGGSIDMHLTSYNWFYGNERNLFVRSNRFTSSGRVNLAIPYHVSTYIENNLAKNSTGNKACFFDIDVGNTRESLTHNVTVSTNMFEETHGQCVFRLTSSDYKFNGTFNYNQILASTTREAAVILDTSGFTFFNNILDNPLADYELKVLKTGTEEVKADQNWWGTIDPVIAGTRILHKTQDQRLLQVNFLPILTDQKFDCSEVGNCTAKGECVRPNGCRCISGWTGADCSHYDCSGVGNCNGNGDCVGPNKCDCRQGWEGESCVLATCHEVGDCSGHERGFCVLPNQCACFPQYTGSDCSQCAALRWGPDCLPCPRCQHGICNTTNGQCECEADNWAGELCDRCSETFYGPYCLPYINILNVIPSSGPDTGDTVVHVWGHNFPETDNKIYHCRFGNTEVNGTWISKEHVVCNNPQNPKGVVDVEISADGQEFTRNQTKFTYYEVCPPGSCGKMETPSHGYCLFGGCVCTLPWSGADCSTEIMAPVISPDPLRFTMVEGNEFRLLMNLTQGSQPIDWFIYKAPSGMVINQRSGEIYWERTVASGTPYNITVRASNLVGRSVVQLVLIVPLSYNVTIDELSPSGSLPSPKSIQIKGHVNFFTESTASLIAFVDLKIRNKGVISSTISVVTSPNSQNKIEGVYFPKAGDSGLFEVDGRHPSDSGFTAQKTWSVLGMKCVPGYVQRQAYLDTDVVEIRNVAVLKNDGIGSIQDINATVDGVGGPLGSVVVRVNNRRSDDETASLISSLAPDSELDVHLIITASRPLRGTIAVIFTSALGTMARMRIGLQLNVRKPVLILSSKSLSDSIPRAAQKTYQVNITNEGEVPARALKVTLPTEPRLDLTSFSNSETQATEDGLDLQPGETAVLILTVTTGSDDVLGEFRGSVALNSDLASASINYIFYVTSLDKLNVSVKVEDEFTYFASDKPLVSGAVVTLRNPRRGYQEQRITTNETEFVIFEDVNEDRYTLTATAPGHASYSAVIIAKPSDSTFSIFLQRVAVTYTWTVTPTTFEDKYIVTLDSTFETQVPMPVVTVEPANINLIPYEEGKKDVINFNITNHGLIRAENVRLVIPGNHQTLLFRQTVEPIGDLAANTSIIVPVLVSVKSRVKRNMAQSACGLKMLYDYFCGQTRTGGQDITLSRQYPGRPPLPCGGGGFGAGGYGGGGGYVGISGYGTGLSQPSSSIVVYNPVTPLSCDCAISLIKDCALSFHPIAGCAVATVGLGTSSGFLGGVKAGLDFGFACILSPLSAICPWCGLAATLYSVLNCVYYADKNCDSSRRRRAADSEVVQGLINSNGPMRNYLLMMKEIYGGEEMFDVYDNSWMNAFNLALSEDSVDGQFLSQGEITSIVAALNVSLVPAVQKFLLRWNKTVTAWEDGTLTTLGPDDGVMAYNTIMTRSEQFERDTQTAKERGFGSIFDDFDNAVAVYQEKQKKGDKDEGVCAKVRVRIVQELVLTRDAFNARLEIENGEQSALENIAVSVNIRATYGDGTYTNDRFSVGNPTLVGITAVDGSGRLEQDVSGTAEWLIIPYSTAAVKEDTLYDVGGTLSYSVDGSEFTIKLLPDTITVKPNPSLILNYFHEKYVQGDDPMTADITEPVVPFSLAVMVSNGAYGVARQLKITSAQPEIIENEKGLLVSFKIIGAQLGSDPVTPSLSINFGDIDSFETKTARWLLTSSLKGKFYNFTATFENINPLGDPQLSIMDHLGYHELIHLVRLESSEDDLDDFLVNDVLDEDEMADAVYDSSNGFFSSPVISTSITKFEFLRSEVSESRTYSYVNLTVAFASKEESAYTYTRLVNNITRDSISESLLEVIREDGQRIRVGKNAWQTSYYHDKFYLHIFDHVSDTNNTIVSYSLLFGPRNLYTPLFTQEVYEGELAIGQAPGVVLKVTATDKDPNSVLKYALHNTSHFTINEVTGEIRNEIPLEEGFYRFSVTVEDDGRPSLSDSATVSVTVSEEVTMKPENASQTSVSVSISSSTDASWTSDTSSTKNVSVTTEASSTGNFSTTTESSSTGNFSSSMEASTATEQTSESSDSTRLTSPRTSSVSTSSMISSVFNSTTRTGSTVESTTQRQSETTVNISESNRVVPVILLLILTNAVTMILSRQ